MLEDFKIKLVLDVVSDYDKHHLETLYTHAGNPLSPSYMETYEGLKKAVEGKVLPMTEDEDYQAYPVGVYEVEMFVRLVQGNVKGVEVLGITDKEGNEIFEEEESEIPKQVWEEGLLKLLRK